MHQATIPPAGVASQCTSRHCVSHQCDRDGRVVVRNAAFAPWQNMHVACSKLSPLEAVHTAADIHNSQSTDRPSCLYSHVTARASGCTLVAPAPAADARAALRSRDACRSAW